MWPSFASQAMACHGQRYAAAVAAADWLAPVTAFACRCGALLGPSPACARRQEAEMKKAAHWLHEALGYLLRGVLRVLVVLAFRPKRCYVSEKARAESFL